MDRSLTLIVLFDSEGWLLGKESLCDFFVLDGACQVEKGVA
jgi:hypothetical protein